MQQRMLVLRSSTCPRNEADRHAFNKHPMPGDNDATLTAWHSSGKRCSLSMSKKSVHNSESCLPQQVRLGQLLRQLFVQQLPQRHADLGSLEQTAQTDLSVSAWSDPVMRRRHLCLLSGSAFQLLLPVAIYVSSYATAFEPIACCCHGTPYMHSTYRLKPVTPV